MIRATTLSDTKEVSIFTRVAMEDHADTFTKSVRIVLPTNEAILFKPSQNYNIAVYFVSRILRLPAACRAIGVNLNMSLPFFPQ
jgi:hypothetical protein